MQTQFKASKLLAFSELMQKKGITTMTQMVDMLSQGTHFSPSEQRVYIDFLMQQLSQQTQQLPKFTDSTSVGNYFANKYSDLDHEEMHLLMTDNTGHITADERVSMGGLKNSAVDIRIILKRIILNNAMSIFVCHNHPSGNLRPSAPDMEVTNAIINGCKAIRVECLDHFIVGNGSYFSMREASLM